MWQSAFLLTIKKGSRWEQEGECSVSAASICQWSSLSIAGVQRLHMALVAFLFCSSSSSKQGTIKLRDAESRILGQTIEARKELWRKVIKIRAVLKGSWKLFLVRHLVFNLFSSKSLCNYYTWSDVFRFYHLLFK